MNIDNFEPVLEHIANRIGIRARANDRAEWSRAIKSRMAVHRMARAQEYLQLLKSEAVEKEGEWRWLLPLLTNGESYFLRDQGQFSLLRNRLIPELIEKRRQQKSIRIWSAGCSTGEEPYSLALLVQQLVPPNWNVSILGTDVNEDSLQKARRGVYSAWSFRALSPEIRERCFHQVADGFELEARLKNMVRFERDNLCDNDRANAASTQEMDLILCRNVLIYFQPDAVTKAIARFASSLREGGYLLTGHAELHHHNTSPLITRSFPESTAYQCCDSQQVALPLTRVRHVVPPPVAPGFAPRPTPKIVIPSRTTTRTVPLLPSIPAAISRIEMSVPAPKASSVASLCQAAKNHANAGRHEAAINSCKDAIAIDPVATDAYFVWAQVLHELGNFEEAKELFKKVIYLSPTHVEAYIELAAMYEYESDGERARRMLQAALTAIRSESGDTMFSGDTTTEEMTKQLERMVSEKDSGSSR